MHEGAGVVYKIGSYKYTQCPEAEKKQNTKAGRVKTTNMGLTIHYCSGDCRAWFMAKSLYLSFDRFISATPHAQQLRTFEFPGALLSYLDNASLKTLVQESSCDLSSLSKPNYRVWQEICTNYLCGRTRMTHREESNHLKVKAGESGKIGNFNESFILKPTLQSKTRSKVNVLQHTAL